MTDTRAEAIAADLARQHELKQPFRPVEEAEADLALGYEVQDHLIAGWEPLFGAVASWKVGLTSQRMQRMCNVSQPIAGAVFASRIHASPARLQVANFVRLGIEAEMAVRIARPLPDRPIAIEEISDYVDAVAAAFEIIEDRDADYAKLDAISMVADNSWNAGIILGDPTPTGHDRRLLDIEGRLYRDGSLIETGQSKDAGGDPLGIVAWLANALRERGRCLAPGQWVMTGSIVRTQFPKAGESFTFRLGDFSPVEVRID